jgi:hypothetical protein
VHVTASSAERYNVTYQFTTFEHTALARDEYQQDVLYTIMPDYFNFQAGNLTYVNVMALSGELELRWNFYEEMWKAKRPVSKEFSLMEL